jgi:uncharacterized protein YuzE
MTLPLDRARMSWADPEGPVHLVYDSTTDVAYLRLRPLRPGELLGPTLLVEHDREFPGSVALDFSLEDGAVVGLEFLEASRCLPAEVLARAERADRTNGEARLEERVLRRLAAGVRAVAPPHRGGRRPH